MSRFGLVGASPSRIIHFPWLQAPMELASVGRCACLPKQQMLYLI